MLRAVPYLLAWFAFLIGVVGMTSRYVPVVNHAVLAVAGLAPYLAIGGAAVSTLVLLMVKRPGWAAVPVALLIAAAGVQLPLFTAAKSGTGTAVRVLTFNAKEGVADPDALAAAAREQTDLLAVQELSAELADALNGRLAAEFPFQALHPGKGGGGTGIWSRYPIVSSSRIGGYRLGATSATVRVPGAAADTVLLNLHVVGPWPYPIGEWQEEIAHLPGTLADIRAAAGTGAAIIAGDFNATRDMLPFRRLLSDGVRDAVEQSGSGLTPTFPADGPTPPLLGIDHILTANSSASGAHTVRIAGSDHLGLSATVHLG